MKFLIDTQAFIWFVENNKNLPTKIKKELENPENLIIVSIASLWEMTIKMSLGKLILNCEIDEMIEKVYANGFEILPILPEHIIKLSTLDSIHRDPFDRIIISQALTENIVLVSSDDIFDNYPKLKRVWK
ncbi:MAG: type II toxin-antitoxin system VapC family toxin [Bacteroidota bacterium]